LIVDILTVQDDAINISKQQVIFKFPVFLQQEPNWEIHAQEMIVTDPVVIVTVHNQRTADFSGKGEREMLQIQTVGNIPLLIQILFRGINSDFMPPGHAAQYVCLVSAAARERLTLSCYQQNSHSTLSLISNNPATSNGFSHLTDQSMRYTFTDCL